MQGPALAGHGLDDVVAVERLVGLEVVERAARAARAAHVHVNDGEADQVADDGDAALGARRTGVPVARVLDHCGIGALVDRPGQPDVDRELRAVARGQVLVALPQRLVVRACV
jgi:hypothetical protein